MRTRDVGFAAVRYDNGLTLGALSLFETVAIFKPTGDIRATGLLSLFSDGRWSTQGSLVGSRLSTPLPLSAAFQKYFSTVRGEVVVDAGSSAQQGLMPTFQLLGASRLRFDGERRRLTAGASVARTFDGTLWRTTVQGEGEANLRLGSAEYRVSFTPMQLSGGDALADWEGGVTLPWRGIAVEGSLGARLGEAQRQTVTWGATTVVIPWRDDVVTTFSIGTYPTDLLQGLPGGRYAAVNLRLPNGRLPRLRRPVVLPPAPTRPGRPDLAVTERLALAIGDSYDSANLREIRVWAPGIAKVELVADFTQWVPVPLVRVGPGEWRGYYHVAPGAHRLNLLLNGTELDVPVNLARVADDFSGAVGIVVVR